MLEILLPFGLPPDELSRDLLTSLRTPALAQLLARASAGPTAHHSGFQPSLPHEIWLEQQLGPFSAGPTTALQGASLSEADLASGVWFMLFPVHLHIARDHLVLTDQRQLSLSDAQARSLFGSAAELFHEAGLHLRYGDGGCWFLRADGWQDMQTSSLDAACGHNVEIWMPKGPQARAWRKLQNEVQMIWHDAAVNHARQAQGNPVVNSLWLQRIAPASDQTAPPSGKTLYHASTGADTGSGKQPDPDSKPGCGNHTSPTHHGSTDKAPEPERDGASRGCSNLPAFADLHTRILYADTLISPALASDWAAWLDAFAALDANWFAPLLANKAVWPLRLTLCHGQRLRQFTCSRLGHLAIWRNNGLPRLTP